MSIVCTLQNQLKHIKLGCDNVLSKTFNINALVNVLSYVQTVCICVQKIYDLFVIYFKEATLNKELKSRTIFFLLNHLFLGLNALENIFKGSLHYSSFFCDEIRLPTLINWWTFVVLCVSCAFIILIWCLEAWTLYRVGFTSACLTICKDGSVVALHAAVSNWSGNMIKDWHLVNRWITNKVKVEYLAILAKGLKLNLGASIVYFNTASIC